MACSDNANHEHKTHAHGSQSCQRDSSRGWRLSRPGTRASSLPPGGPAFSPLLASFAHSPACVRLRMCFRDEGAPTQDKTLTEDDIETNWDECIETFDAMELREELLRGIYAYGFEKPSAIQQVSGRLPGGEVAPLFFPSAHAARPSLYPLFSARRFSLSFLSQPAFFWTCTCS